MKGIDQYPYSQGGLLGFLQADIGTGAAIIVSAKDQFSIRPVPPDSQGHDFQVSGIEGHYNLKAGLFERREASEAMPSQIKTAWPRLVASVFNAK